MQIVKPYAKMLSPAVGYIGDYRSDHFTIEDGVAILKRIEYAARVSHASEDAITGTSYDRFIRSVVLQHGDMSVIEHEKVTVEALVDRGITHEWVRHRLGSYTQESTRFINYSKKGGEAKVIMPLDLTDDQEGTWRDSVMDSEASYMKLLREGCTPQIARSVFPTGLASKIIVTFNLRNWRHFFIMRTSAQAHPQMREVTIPLLADFQANIPILFEDIKPGGQQSEMMRLLR